MIPLLSSGKEKKKKNFPGKLFNIYVITELQLKYISA